MATEDDESEAVRRRKQSANGDRCDVGKLLAETTVVSTSPWRKAFGLGRPPSASPPPEAVRRCRTTSLQSTDSSSVSGNAGGRRSHGSVLPTLPTRCRRRAIGGDVDTAGKACSEILQNADGERNRKLSDGSVINVDRSVYHVLKVVLKEGRELVIRDSCGTSDPYVKFKVGRKLCYRSKTIKRNLNPRWDETFSIPIDDPLSTVISVKVYDYDRGLLDDRMGFSVIQTCDLQLNQPTDLKLMLSDGRRKLQSPSESYFGYLLLQCTLVHEDKLQPPSQTLNVYLATEMNGRLEVAPTEVTAHRRLHDSKQLLSDDFILMGLLLGIGRFLSNGHHGNSNGLLSRLSASLCGRLGGGATNAREPDMDG